MRKTTVIIGCVVLFTVIACAASAESLNELLGYEPDQKLLIVNGDDAGMCHSANQAVMDCMENGLMTTSTIMVPCPWFPEIAEYAREHPDKDFGVHLTHTAEWGLYRWGPVAGKAAVPGLVDEQGYLWKDDEPVWQHATADEAEREARAQIERALAFGVDVTHIDSHMGAMQLNPAFLERYIKLAREYDVPMRGGPKAMMTAVPNLAQAFVKAGELGIIFPDDLIHGLRKEGEPVDVFWKRVLRNLQPGVTELYIHTNLASEESKAITGSWKERAEEHRLFTTDPEVRQIIKDGNIVLIGYRELRELQRARRKAAALVPAGQ
ncbi:MAG: polysaccharide deacetylase family protein [Armatimonadota bacterium]|nr:MAG: polysaccharide deacetylase family protein [Armatimonadota bacterium]